MPSTAVRTSARSMRWASTTTTRWWPGTSACRATAPRGAEAHSPPASCGTTPRTRVGWPAGWACSTPWLLASRSGWSRTACATGSATAGPSPGSTDGTARATCARTSPLWWRRSTAGSRLTATGTGRWSTTTSGDLTSPGSACTASTATAASTGCAGSRPTRWVTTRPGPTGGSSPACAPATGRCSIRTEPPGQGRSSAPCRDSEAGDAGERLLGLDHDLGDQVGGRCQGMDGAHPLPGGVALAFGVDVGGVLAGAQVEGAVLHRPEELVRKGTQLVGMLLEERGVPVADHPHRLAGEGTADDGPVLAGPEQRVLEAGYASGLGGGDEPRPHPHTVGAEGQRGGQAPAVEDPAGSHDGDLAAHGVDDLGNQGHGGHLAGVAPGLGALGHHDVAPGIEGPTGVGDLAAHVDDQDAVTVAELHHLGGYPQPGHEDRGTARNDLLHLAGQVTGHGGEQVDPEWLVGGRPHRGHLLHHALVAHGGRPQAAEAPGLGDGTDQRCVGDTTHAGQHHRMLDGQDLGQSCLHGDLLR